MTRRDNDPTIHATPHPSEFAGRHEAVAQLRAALARIAPVDFLPDSQVVVLARTHYSQRTGVQAAIDQADWQGLAFAADVLRELQQGLQNLDIAALR
ncbi:hypothetical protein MZK47_07295 [Microbacterium aerolatum]|uniref:hypothetical protein n=1 Tax=Microbacterium aerolatum TaxID=153731 RepID=UPI00200091D3|nr:hypothetical protein [Microbacterium aerolatum]MCK3769469.1 hypothetical protein [Microbacterium aerolatum]